MHRNKLIDHINREIRIHFKRNKEAAKEFGISEGHLSRVLKSAEGPIPKVILDWIGYEEKKVITYHKR